MDNLLRDTPYFEAIRWYRDWFHVDHVGGLDEQAWEARRLCVLAALSQTTFGSLGSFIARVEANGGFHTGEVLSVLKHLVARRLVDFDPCSGVPTLNSPVTVFTARAAMRLAA